MTNQPGPPEAGPPLLVTARTELERNAFGRHAHAHHLLAWSGTATVALRTETRDWLVPPTHGLWVPAGTQHTVEVLRSGRAYVVVLGVGCPITWPEPTGVLITPLIRELIIHLDQHQRDDRSPAARIEAVLLELLEPVRTTTFDVAMPTDPRTRAIADALMTDPADPRDLAAWARAVNSSVRTVSRLFAEETGLTFAQWRTHIRVRAALGHLARGTSVGATARAVGYRKPGAFSEAFQRITGQSPGIYQSS